MIIISTYNDKNLEWKDGYLAYFKGGSFQNKDQDWREGRLHTKSDDRLNTINEAANDHQRTIQLR